MVRLLLIIATLGFSNSTFAVTDTVSIYCETGDPSGRGARLYLNGEESDSGMTADIALSVNSRFPRDGRPNIQIERKHRYAENIGDKGQKSWLFPLSPAFQVRLAKVTDSGSVYWTAAVESRRGKFEPVELGCQ